MSGHRKESERGKTGKRRLETKKKTWKRRENSTFKKGNKMVDGWNDIMMLTGYIQTYWPEKQACISTNLNKRNRQETTPRHSYMYVAEFRPLCDTCRWRCPQRCNFRKMTPIGRQAARCTRQAVCQALCTSHLIKRVYGVNQLGLCSQPTDWLMIAYIALFSALLSRLTALACDSTWVTS